MEFKNIETILEEALKKAFKNLYEADIKDNIAPYIQKTRKDFEGDFTINIFNFLKFSKKTPEQTANEVGQYLMQNNQNEEFEKFNVIKGFLNISINNKYWNAVIKYYSTNKQLKKDNNEKVIIEFSSPNTNKPLHLGHIRNNLLGDSIARILKKVGKDVVKVNLVNDRGIHICKSMLAWQKWGNKETPDSSKLKGDFLVGKYYIKFDVEYKKQIKELIEQGKNEETAKKEATLIIEAQEMLQKWEEGDKKVRQLWEKMNNWVYEGFDKTYKNLGISFDKIYKESETYLKGKELIQEGLKSNAFYKKENGAIAVDLSNEGLDEKVLLRSDGTSVYITQDLGTALSRYNEYKPNQMIYVVGNEQDYHFQVLKLILSKKLQFEWANNIYHLSYGMVELPEGKMKSREGTVVDADDLIQEMIQTAKQKTEELGKIDVFNQDEAIEIYKKIGLSALKYYILKVDPKKKILFNPTESIDFNGNTGPFIQYTYARIKSLIRKDGNFNQHKLKINIQEPKEKELAKLIYEYHKTLNEAAKEHSPALIANYIYELAKSYNQFYHEHQILKEEDNIKNSRLGISATVADIIKESMELLGIEVPEKM